MQLQFLEPLMYGCRISPHFLRASKGSPYGERLLQQNVTVVIAPMFSFATSWYASGSTRKQMHTPPFNPTIIFRTALF